MSLSFPVYLSLQFSYRGEGYKAEVHSGGKIPALPLAEQGGAETKVAEDAEDGEDDWDRDLMMMMMVMIWGVMSKEENKMRSCGYR